MATKQVLVRLNKLKFFMLQHPEGAKLKDIIDYMGEDRQVVRKDLDDIGAINDSHGLYAYPLSEEEIKLAQQIIVVALQGRKEE